jgi:hypothetical protein
MQWLTAATLVIITSMENCSPCIVINLPIGLSKQVADLKLLIEETHKFESHYIDNLISKSMMITWGNSYLFHLELLYLVALFIYFYLVFTLSFNWLQEVRRSGSKDPQSITLINFLVPLYYFKDWRTRLVTKLVNHK